TMLLLNDFQSHYTKDTKVPEGVTLKVPDNAPRDTVGRPYKGEDATVYAIVHVRDKDDLNPGVPPGRYLVNEKGQAVYRTDNPIDRKNEKMDNGQPAPKAFSAPQPELFASLIKGILGGELNWNLVFLGVLIALMLEITGVPVLPFAVGMYIPFSSTLPIFIGGLLRWGADRFLGKKPSESETETSSGVLLASGYIAGGTLCGLIVLFFAFNDDFVNALNIGQYLGAGYDDGKTALSK